MSLGRRRKHWFVGPDGDDSGPYFGHVTLRSGEGAELFTGRFSQGKYGDKVEFHNIEAFRPGDWLGELVEPAERIEALGRERSVRHELEELRTQRERFGLDVNVASLENDSPRGRKTPR